MADMNSSADSNIPVLSRTGAYLKAISMRTFLRLTIIGILIALVALALGTPGPAQAVEVTLVKNTGQNFWGTSGQVKKDNAQRFSTGGNPTGYTLNRIGVDFLSGPSGDGIMTVTVRGAKSSDGGQPSSTSLFTLTNPGSYQSNAVATFTAPPAAILNANTNYFVVFASSGDTNNESDQPNYRLTSSDDEDGNPASGWSIANTRVVNGSLGSGSWGPASATMKIEVSGEVRPPDAPTNLSAAPNDGQVTLSWTNPGNSTITGYKISRDVGPFTDIGSSALVIDSDAGTLAYTVDGLTNGVTYTFSVLAVNDSGDGPASTTTATPILPPAAPTNFSAKQTGDGEVTLEWDKASGDQLATGYQYSQDPASDVPSWTDVSDVSDVTGSDPARLSGTITGLTAGNNEFAVRAVNSAGGGTASDSVSVTIEAQALAPSAFNVEAGDTRARLTWGSSGDTSITKYQSHLLREVIKLTADDRAENDEFGGSIALDGATLVVGVSGEDFDVDNVNTISNSGAAYIYTRAGVGWTLAAKLTASFPVADARFGRSVAVDGDTVVVGAYQDDLFDDQGNVDVNNAGAAYIFTRNPDSGAWSQAAKLESDDAAKDDDFGNSVAIDGDTVVVGAPKTGDNKGTAYVFVRPDIGWTDTIQTAKLTISSSQAQHGASVAISDDTIVVGAPRAKIYKGLIQIPQGGIASVFIRPEAGWADTTSSTAEFTGDHKWTNSHFGSSVAIDGDTIVVGAIQYNNPNDNWARPGAALVFVKPTNGWTDSEETALITSPDGSPNDDDFGSSVAIEGNTVVVGYKKADGGGSDSGKVYVYTKPDDGWGDTNTPTTRHIADDRRRGDNFGHSVAIDNGVIAVGAYHDDSSDGQGNANSISNSGSAYVFGTKLDWTEIPGSGSDTTSHILTGLKNNIEYTFRVRAVNAAGDGESSGTVVATPSAAVSTPANLMAMQASAGQVLITWDVSTPTLSVDSYQYWQDNAANWVDIADSDSSTDSYTVTGLTPGQTYTFRVRAYNSEGGQQSSDPRTVTLTPRPAAPSAFAVDADFEQVTLTWDAPSDESGVTGYELMQLVEQIELTASDSARNDWFGFSVALDGDTAVIGAFQPSYTNDADEQIIRPGAAYVFTRESGSVDWNQKTKLTAADGEGFDEFGFSVALAGDTVVIGAPGDEVIQGAIYVFSKPESGWPSSTTNATKLTAADGERGDLFGASVAVDGNTIVVGASGFQLTGESPAYVFTRDSVSGTWSQKAKLTASNGAESDRFGSSVAIDAGHIVIGADWKDDDSITDSGLAYLFVKPGTEDGWTDSTETVLLTPSDPTTRGRFGGSISVDGATIVVGASTAHNSNSVSTGAAYVFIEPTDGWANDTVTETAKLTASDGGHRDWFGQSVAVDGATIMVGADNHNNQGSVYLFTAPGDGWVDTTDAVKLAALDGMNTTWFGLAVALDQDTALVSAPARDSNNVVDSGSVFVIDISKWAEITVDTDNESGTVAHTIMSLAADVPYTFAVRAVDIWGAGTPSNDGPVLAIANSPPVFTDGASVTLIVDENSEVVGDPVSATDPDGDDTLTYTLSGTEATSFGIDDSGQISVAAGSALDYESGTTTYSFVVSVTDGKDPDGNATTTIDATIEVTVEVINVEEAGEAFLFSDPGLPIVNSTTTASLNDPDGYELEEVSWRWATSTDQVNWNDISGAISTDYIPSTDDVGYYLRATASYIDGFGSGIETESAVAEWPVAVEGTVFGTPFFASATTTRAVDENAASGTPVGAAVTATDRNYDDLTYTLSGTGASLFEIGADGQITVGTPLNYESATTTSFVVSVTDRKDEDGNADDSIDATIEVEIVVINVNEPGVVTLSPPRPQENSTSTASLMDPDVVEPAISWQWARLDPVDGSDWADISGATSTSYLPAASDVGLYLSITATYNDGFATTTVGASYRSAVLDRDVDVSAPYFDLDVSVEFEIAEGPFQGTRIDVGSPVTATDDEGEKLTYTLSGTDAAPFAIDDQGQISLGTALDFETKQSYIVVVTASDGGKAASIEVTITVGNVEEAGTVTLSSYQPRENTELTAWLSDPDGVDEDAISWQWTRSNSAAGPESTDIGTDSSGYTPAAEDVDKYLRVTASYTDGEGPSKSAFAVIINAVLAEEGKPANEAPFFNLVDPVEFTIPENASTGFVVGSVTATDDDGDELTYSLSGPDKGSFSIDSTGQITVADGVTFDFESGDTTYNVTVEVHDGKDSYGYTDARIDASIDVVITIIEVVDQAGSVSLSPSQPQVGTRITATLTDPDGSLPGISWQWSRSDSLSGPWANIGSNSGSYTPSANDVGDYLRATATYTDGHGTGKSASVTSANRVQPADPSVSQPGRPQPTPTPAPTPTPVPITVVPDEDVVPVPTVAAAPQSVHLIDPTKSSEVTSSDGAVNLRFPRESRDRTYQVKVDRSPSGCAGGVDPLAGIQVACFSVDIYTAEGDLETNVRLIRPASGEIRMAPDQVDDLGGLTVLYQAYVLGGVSVLKRDGAADTWSPVRFELEITGDGGARIRIPSIRTFSSFALTIDETILAQAGGQVAALATAMPSPTAAVGPTATPTGMDLSPTPLPGVDVGDATAPPGLLLALLAAGLVLTIAGTRAVRGRRTNSRR